MAGTQRGWRRHTLTALVARPGGLVDAAVIYASVSSPRRRQLAAVLSTIARPLEDQPPDRADIRATAGRVAQTPGAPPRRDRTFGRVTEPLLVHHGTRDDTCPIRWSGSDGQGAQGSRQGRSPSSNTAARATHLSSRRQRSIERVTVAFFDNNLN